MTTITQNPTKTLAGFQIDFVETLIDEGFHVGIKDMEGPQREVIDISWLLMGLLLHQANGKPIAEISEKEVPQYIAELTRLIWELGGEFGNSMYKYSKKDEKENE
jgi:hypothetical protein